MAGIVFGCIAPHPPIVIPGIGSDKDRDIVWQTISGMEDLAETLGMSNPETVIIVSPHNYYTAPINMTISFTNIAEGNLHEWGTRLPGYQFENDLKLAELIMEEAQRANISVQSVHPNTYNLDHGILVPLHFLADSFKGASLLPITFSSLPLNTHFYFGKAIQKAAERSHKRVCFIASGDLSHYLRGSHYGYHSEGEVFEKQLAEAIATMDSSTILGLDPGLIERAGECGLRSIVILLGALDGMHINAKIISHEGPLGVGYMVASFQIHT